MMQNREIHESSILQLFIDGLKIDTHIYLSITGLRKTIDPLKLDINTV